MWKRKPPYSQKEIAEQICQLSEITDLEAREIATETLRFMLHKVMAYNEKYDTCSGLERHGKVFAAVSNRQLRMVRAVGKKE